MNLSAPTISLFWQKFCILQSYFFFPSDFKEIAYEKRLQLASSKTKVLILIHKEFSFKIYFFIFYFFLLRFIFGETSKNKRDSMFIKNPKYSTSVNVDDFLLLLCRIICQISFSASFCFKIHTAFNIHIAQFKYSG